MTTVTLVSWPSPWACMACRFQTSDGSAAKRATWVPQLPALPVRRVTNNQGDADSEVAMLCAARVLAQAALRVLGAHLVQAVTSGMVAGAGLSDLCATQRLALA